MSDMNLDALITEINELLSYLLSYRNIISTGNCNECALKDSCTYVPRAGETVRYNCVGFAKKE